MEINHTDSFPLYSGGVMRWRWLSSLWWVSYSRDQTGCVNSIASVVAGGLKSSQQLLMPSAMVLSGSFLQEGIERHCSIGALVFLKGANSKGGV